MSSAEDVCVGGGVAEGFGAVADAFRSNFRRRGELGAAVAVYRDGEPVVDLWGGWRDRQRSRRWESDSLVPVFSTTKGMSAAAMAAGSGMMVSPSRDTRLIWTPLCASPR